MTIVVWEPPHRAVVRHTGRVVRGSGAFEVRELVGGRQPGGLVGVDRPAARHPRPRGLAARTPVGARRRVLLAAPARALRRGRSMSGAVSRTGRPRRCPWGAQHARLPALPRRRVGQAVARRRGAVRAASASRRSSRGCPGSRSCASGRRSARRSPSFDPARVAAFDERRRRAAAGRRRHRAQPRQGCRDDRQRARCARAGRLSRRPAVVVRAAGRRGAPRGTRRRARSHRRVDRDGQGAQAPRVSASSDRRRPTR